jgi:hypothetical protein
MRSFSTEKDDLIQPSMSKNSIVDSNEKFYANYTSKFMKHLLDLLFENNDGNKNISLVEIQKRIELLIINEFDAFYSDNQVKYVGGITSNTLVPSFIKYILYKEDSVRENLKKLKARYKKIKTIRKDELFKGDIYSVVDTRYLVNLCLSQFLLVYTYQDSDNDKNYNLVSVTISMGKKVLNRYFNKLRDNHNKVNNTKISYSVWLDK